MKTSPVTEIKIAAVLIPALVLLGCEAPSSIAEANPEQPVPVSVAQPDLVTVNPATPAPVPVLPATNATATMPEAPSEAPVPPPAPAIQSASQLSAPLQEVVRLTQSGVGEEVVLAFIQNSTTPFNPTPDEILYLTDVGVSDVIITALVNHKGTVAAAAAPAPMMPIPQGGPTVQMEAPAPAPTYNPEPQLVTEGPQIVQQAAAPVVVENNYFYSSLSPYGSWTEVADYGYCWQPTVAVIHRDWRPYSDRGRWLYSDCGWYWQSDYSWGWAPFHYGRWFHHPVRGWCWRPDSVWAPAWVSWRYSDSHCGWAPLPPGAHYRAGLGFTYYGARVGVNFSFGLGHSAWTFVPAHRFHDRDVWRHRIAAREAGNIYRHTRVINDYTVDRHHTIVNRGVTPERGPAWARTEPPKVVIRDIPDRPRTPIRPDRLHQEGAETVVYRPKPPVPSPQPTRGSVADGRTIPSRPGTTPITQPRAIDRRDNVGLTPGAGAPVTTQPGMSPTRPSNLTPRSSVPSPSSEVVAKAEPQPGRGLGEVRNTPATIPAQPGTITTPQRTPTMTSPQSNPGVGTQPSRYPVSPNNLPARAVPQNVQPAAPTVPNAVTQPAPVPRQEPTRVTVITPQRPVPSSTAQPLTTYRAPTPATPQPRAIQPPVNSTAPAYQRPAPSAPQSVAPPAQVYRQELPKPATSVAPEKLTRTMPTPSYTAPTVRSAPAPTPSYSAPTRPSYTPPQTYSAPQRAAPSYSAPQRAAPSYSAPQRAAPSYSAPARSEVQPSRPVQSVPQASAPAARSAPQSVGQPSQTSRQPSQTSRSGNRNQQ